ncbi:hypothetical protein [Kyrpidia spormannii]|uniref:hypothetical protein n=1 Tax=Kyrpidia spormannii TaxID=2055160 RepID=UPI001055683E|nr:hypothetical protein [Kyrpidia spormannii]
MAWGVPGRSGRECRYFAGIMLAGCRYVAAIRGGKTRDRRRRMRQGRPWAAVHGAGVGGAVAGGLICRGIAREWADGGRIMPGCPGGHGIALDRRRLLGPPWIAGL